MITENVMTQVTDYIFLSLTSAEKWDAARYTFNNASAAEAWLTGFAMTSLIIAVILVFWVTIKHKRLEDRLKKEIDTLKADNEKLRKQIAKLSPEISEEFPEEMELTV